MRIALVHALIHSMPPIKEAFHRLWPEAALQNILDDTLSSDLLRSGRITKAMHARFLSLTEYALANGADAIMFTCSAFGPCIEACAARFPDVPILKPNEAMIEEAATFGGPIGLLASFPPTLASMPSEFPANLRVEPWLAAGALDALDQGDVARHDQLAAEAALALSHCTAIALAQFSLARAAPSVAIKTGKTVLTTPDCAVRKLRRLTQAEAFGRAARSALPDQSRPI